MSGAHSTLGWPPPPTLTVGDPSPRFHPASGGPHFRGKRERCPSAGKPARAERETSMLMAYASIAAFFLVAAGFMIGSLLVGKLIRPNNPYAEKLETYECGEAPVGQAWFN